MESIVLPHIVSAGIYNSRVAYKGVKFSRKRTAKLFEIELPVQNSGKSYIDNESHPVQNDTIVCVKPGQFRYSRLPYMCYFIHFVVTDGILYDILMHLPNFISIKDKTAYIDLFKAIDEHNKPGSKADELMIQSCIFNLVYMMNNDAASQVQSVNTNSNNKQIIETAIKFIDENISGDLTLNTVSEKVSLSPVYFHKLFKASTGVTLHDYVEERRIKQAVDFLISTNMTLTEVAYECGFSSQSYFSYAFKRRMKDTPRSYVKNIYKKYDL